MMLYYAPGGGLGHFSRAIAFIHSQPYLSVKDTVVMVAERALYSLKRSSFADNSWQSLRLAKIPESVFSKPSSLAVWLKDWLQDHRPSQIYLDTFPAGIAGEWSDIRYEARFFYVGRFLDWQAYPYPVIISFEKAFRVEGWHAEQEKQLVSRASCIQDISLAYPEAVLSTELEFRIKKWQADGREVWTVVHSEPAHEAEALLNFARDLAFQDKKSPVFLVCSSLDPEQQAGVYPVKLFPAYALFPWVDRIITACGFNLMQQAVAYRHKHLCMPFPRRYDDQFQRFRRWKAAAK